MILDSWLADICNMPGASGNAIQPGILAGWQLRRLRESLQRAYSLSLLYRDRFSCLPLSVRMGLTEGTWPESFQDFEALPFTSAADLTGSSSWRRLLCVSQDEVARMVTLRSSGSTGLEKRLAFAMADLASTVEFFSVGLTVMARPGETLLVLLPGADRPGGVADVVLRGVAWLGEAARSGRRLRWEEVWAESPSGLIPLPVPGGSRARGIAADPAVDPYSFLRMVDEHSPATMVAAPRQLRRLLTSSAVGECLAPFTALRAVLSSSEPLDDSLRHTVEERWHCEVFDHYGLTESGYGLGVECAAHAGYHLRESDCFVEIVHPRTGQVLPLGEEGEIVLTTLGARAMPLLRYRTRDVAAMLPGPCPCGSPLRRLGPIRGRLDSQGKLLWISKGNKHG